MGVPPPISNFVLNSVYHSWNEICGSILLSVKLNFDSVMFHWSVFTFQVLRKSNVNPSLLTDIEEALKKMTGYIEGLRLHMQGLTQFRPHRALPRSLSREHTPGSVYKLNRLQRAMVSRWEKMTDQVIWWKKFLSIVLCSCISHISQVMSLTFRKHTAIIVR